MKLKQCRHCSNYIFILDLRLNTWLQWIELRQLQDETRHILLLEFGATYIICLAVSALHNAIQICVQEYNKNVNHHLENQIEL